MTEPVVTKIQLKLTRPALERLIGDDAELETIIGHQAMATIVDRHVPKLIERITAQVNAGLDLQGYHKLNVLIGEKIKGVIANELGNYLRINEYQVSELISAEVKKQLPAHIQHAVKATMEKMTKKLLKDLLPGE